MSGICGYISKTPVPQEELWEMTNTMAHRGPDDSGIWENTDNGYNIGFGHRRLAVQDLSPQAHQPMVADDGSIAVVLDGRIYNHEELRTELEEGGCRFLSRGSAEVLLWAYQKWGEACVSKLSGMFAFAIFDKQNHKVIFARDRIGEKSLYFYHHGQTLVFGSELKPIMRHPEFVRDINTEQIASYMINMSFYSPNTIFHNTYKLEPGHIMIWENGSVKKHKYWDLIDKYKEGCNAPITDFEEAKAGLKERMRESVKNRLSADVVPAGTFLSGGIDSGLITAMAADLSDKPVKTFTVGFWDKERNEADKAKAISEHLGTEHNDAYMTDEDVVDLVTDIPLHFDEPFSDASQIPSLFACRLAGQEVSAVLSGEGGGTFFSALARNYSKANLLSIPVRTGHDKLALMKLINKNPRPRLGLFTLRTVGMLVKNRNYRGGYRLRATMYEVLSQKMVKGAEARLAGAPSADFQGIDPQERLRLAVMLNSLPEKIIYKMGRTSMGYGIEARYPYADVDVMEYSFHIPHCFRYRDGVEKWLLRQVTYDFIPPQLLNIPKSPFAGPLAKWLSGPLKPLVDKYSNKEILEKQGIFNYKPVQWLISDLERNGGEYKRLLWSFLVFQMWYRHYIEDLWG